MVGWSFFSSDKIFSAWYPIDREWRCCCFELELERWNLRFYIFLWKSLDINLLKPPQKNLTWSVDWITPLLPFINSYSRHFPRTIYWSENCCRPRCRNLPLPPGPRPLCPAGDSRLPGPGGPGGPQWGEHHPPPDGPTPPVLPGRQIHSRPT